MERGLTVDEGLKRAWLQRWRIGDLEKLRCLEGLKMNKCMQNKMVSLRMKMK